MADQTPHNKDYELALMVGRLEGEIKGMISKIDSMQLSIQMLTQQGNKHENMWSKVVGVVTAVSFISSIMWTIAVDKVKHLFN